MKFPTTLRNIEAAEATIGAKLPSSFRTYLLQNNGGEINVLDIPWELNPVRDTSDSANDHRTAIDIAQDTYSARHWHGFPAQAVAIGSDGCGNYLVLLPCDNDPSSLRETVFIWWHEGCELEEVAPDFRVLWSESLG